MAEELRARRQKRRDRRLVDVSPRRMKATDDKVQLVAEEAVMRIAGEMDRQGNERRRNGQALRFHVARNRYRYFFCNRYTNSRHPKRSRKPKYAIAFPPNHRNATLLGDDLGILRASSHTRRLPLDAKRRSAPGAADPVHVLRAGMACGREGVPGIRLKHISL